MDILPSVDCVEIFICFSCVYCQNMAKADIEMDIQRHEDSAGGRRDDEGPLIKYYRASEVLPGPVPALQRLLRKGPATCAVRHTHIHWRYMSSTIITNQRLAKQRLLGCSRWLLGHCYVLLFNWKCFILGAQSENRLKADVRFSVTVRNIGWEIKKVASLYTSDLQLLP